MKYTIDPIIFEKNPNIMFGIVIGKNLNNSQTYQEDHEHLETYEEKLRQTVPLDELRDFHSFSHYRQALKNVGINPNKYVNSIEAMSKRVLKGQDLPRINALVDHCNALSLKHHISLGGHDLKDIDDDLSVRYSTDQDIFLPFGKSDFEHLTAGELVFTAGTKVQTRYWFWRQSELGKMTLETSDVFFQLVAFEETEDLLKAAIHDLTQIISDRFKGDFTVYMVNNNNQSIEF